MLALILAVLLVWYTHVVPAGPIGSRRPVRGGEGHDGEVRGLTPQGLKPALRPSEELDWPEYIGLD